VPTIVNCNSSLKSASSKKNEDGKRLEKRFHFPIIGIGASAGGLETLQRFFSRMSPEANLAFVIIQHLSPNFKSIMASLLAKYTRMTVSEIRDGSTIAPNCVYLNPPTKNVAVFNRTLHLVEPVKSGGINMPIDFFFRSLSEDQKEKAIGIIVSGTASDGTLGIKAIKGEGGMVMAQDPDTAKYDGMPRSAIGTGMVDLILPVEKMPDALISYIKHPFLKSPGKINISATNIQHQVQKFFPSSATPRATILPNTSEPPFFAGLNAAWRYIRSTSWPTTSCTCRKTRLKSRHCSKIW
jgi:two-component system CheB/CheR fusion protein